MGFDTKPLFRRLSIQVSWPFKRKVLTLGKIQKKMLEEASAPLEVAVILALFALGVLAKACGTDAFTSDFLGSAVSFFSGIALMSHSYPKEKPVGIAHITVDTLSKLALRLIVSCIVGFAVALGFSFAPLMACFG